MDISEQPRTTWILTVNQRRARLLGAEWTEHERLHIEERAAVEEEWDEFQHGRPSPRSGRDYHTYASPGHETDERSMRFAREVAHWLDPELRKRGIERLDLFVAPALLGEMRKTLPDHAPYELVEHPSNLDHLEPAQLAEHDAVVELARELRATGSET